MSKIKIVGVGSPFSDDQLGWQVIDALTTQKTFKGYSPEIITFHCSDRPGINLLHLMAGADIAILIDAIKSGAKPGTIHCFSSSELKPEHFPLSSHSIGVIEALALGNELDMLPETIHLYGLEIHSLTANFMTSSVIQTAIPILVTRLEKDLIEYLKKIT